MSAQFTITGQYVDILGKNIFPAMVTVKDGIIASVTPCEEAPIHYILPGFIDSHVHIESSMLIPSSFARLAVTHGTIGTISDPHEIANVCGIEGVYFMIENGQERNEEKKLCESVLFSGRRKYHFANKKQIV